MITSATHVVDTLYASPEITGVIESSSDAGEIALLFATSAFRLGQISR